MLRLNALCDIRKLGEKKLEISFVPQSFDFFHTKIESEISKHSI